ncbi:hypothetical protein QQF64_025538 [Cirrhinus molitorella]|uniref:Transmembrane protein 238 n=1 Tax=Cirrhinus molitorella TaxID=172907 RepID=A0ABR3NPB1_9TELE
MQSVPEHLHLKDSPHSYSREQLTPCSDTVFSLSHNDTFWTLQPSPGKCEYYWQAILLMTSGGSVLLCGMVLSGLYFAGFSMMATNILGPALLSVGLMVLVSHRQQPCSHRDVTRAFPPCAPGASHLSSTVLPLSTGSSSILIHLLKMMALRCIGSCLPLFVMAIIFDIIGVILLFVGIFGDVRMHGVFYGDFLIHTGALLLFASLALWLMWYVGNIRVKEESLDRRSSAAHSVKQLARKLTERLSKTHLKDNSGEKTGSKASTVRNVTWGKSSYFPGNKDLESDMIKCDELSKAKPDDDQFICYQNQAYEDDESCKPIQEETDNQTRRRSQMISQRALMFCCEKRS